MFSQVANTHSLLATQNSGTSSLQRSHSASMLHLKLGYRYRMHMFPQLFRWKEQTTAKAVARFSCQTQIRMHSFEASQPDRNLMCTHRYHHLDSGKVDLFAQAIQLFS